MIGTKQGLTLALVVTLGGCAAAQDMLYGAQSAVGMGGDAANLTGYGNDEFQRRVDAVTLGMTYQQAADAMGKPGKKGSTQQGESATYTYYTWKAPSGKTLDIQFENGRVVNKTY